MDRGRAGSLAVEGETLAAVTSLWRCDDGKDAILALVLVVEKTDQAKAIDWLTKIRCAKPDDVPLSIGPHTPDEDEDPEPEPAPSTKQAPGTPKQPVKRTLPPARPKQKS